MSENGNNLNNAGNSMGQVFCTSCGANNVADAKFCIACGKPLGSGETPNAEFKAASSTPAVGNNVFTNPAGANGAKNIKAFPKKILFAAAAVIAILVIAIGVTRGSKKTLNLNDYVVFEEEGEDGSGEIKVWVDFKSIEKDFKSKVKFAEEEKEEFKYSSLNAINFLNVYGVYYNVDYDESNGSLSNGDTVTVTLHLSDDNLKYLDFDCDLKYSDVTYTMHKLKK